MIGLRDVVKSWATVLHVAFAALLIGSFSLIATPVARAAAATATLSVTSTWQTGFIASFSITNWSGAPLTDWRLEFDMPVGQSVSHTWSSSIAQSGTHFVLTPANWNRIIKPGDTATGGMRGVLSGTYSPPSNCFLNRQIRCTVQ